MIDPQFYDSQANLDPSRPCYTERPADRELLASVLEGTYPLLLSSRKMGKSSLIDRVFVTLREQPVPFLVAKKELTMGSKDQVPTADQWCHGIARDLVISARTLCGFTVDPAWQDWWRTEDRLAPVERFFAFLREFLLNRSEARWVIAIDEIETTISLPFGDDFFASLRSCVTGRASDPALRRLTFILAGVTTPSQLIKDASRTPFNIGQVISIRDFSPPEAAHLLPGLGIKPDEKSPPLLAVLHWTDGHPYLTQRLFKDLATALQERGVEDASEVTDWPGEVSRLVEQRYLRPGVRVTEEHFADIAQRRLAECKQQGTAAGFLRRYRLALRGKTLPDEPLSLAMTQLKLSGLVKPAEDGTLITRNLLYRRVFDQNWVREELAKDPTRWRAFAVGVVVILLVVIPAAFWFRGGSEETRAKDLVQALMNARIEAVPEALTNLQPLQSRAKPLLQAKFDQPQARSVNQLNAAFGLALFGELAPLQQMTRRDPNPTNRTAFIHGYRQWPNDPLRLAEVLQSIATSTDTNILLLDFRSALCAAFALVEWSKLAGPEQAALRQTMQQLYTNAPDGGTHGAAACALNRWEQPLPEIQERTSQPAPSRDWFVNLAGMTMIRIPAGKFQMGGTNFSDAQPVHEVTLTKPFFLSDREVTVALFRQFTNAVASDTNTPPLERLTDWNGEDADYSPTKTCPVQQVSWFDAVKFCNWLSRREGRTPWYRASSETNWEFNLKADGYRLPTEAEWEYACRAVSETTFAFGDDEKLLGEYAWYSANSSSRTWPAGKKLSNLWGAFDLHGNLWEWCQDWYAQDYYQRSPKQDPPGPEHGGTVDIIGTKGEARVLRGGSWFSDTPAYLSSSCRRGGHPGLRGVDVGFRCVLGGVGSAPRWQHQERWARCRMATAVRPVPRGHLTARPTPRRSRGKDAAQAVAGNGRPRGRRPRKSRPAFSGRRPGGTPENSPAIYCWVSRPEQPKSRQGRKRIAQRFIAGVGQTNEPSPVRDDRTQPQQRRWPRLSFVPAGTGFAPRGGPSDESLGYSLPPSGLGKPSRLGDGFP